MSAAQRAPKLWLLTDSETINSFETWRQNLLYIIPRWQVYSFSIHLLEQKDCPIPHPWPYERWWHRARGFSTDRGPENRNLELMLGQIANFCPGIARNTFLKDATSLYDVWQKIRLHLGFQCTGAHFLDLANIRFKPNERPKTLYQRLNAFFQDNLLTPQNGISHHGTTVTVEDMNPSLENTVVYMWLIWHTRGYQRW